MNRDGRFLTPTPPDCSNGLSAPAIGTSRKPVEAEKPSKREIAENSAHERKREKEAIAKLYSGVFRERIPMSSEEALARVPMESKLQWVHGLGKRMVAIGDREADFEYFGPTISQAELEMIDLGEPMSPHGSVPELSYLPLSELQGAIIAVRARHYLRSQKKYAGDPIGQTYYPSGP